MHSNIDPTNKTSLFNNNPYNSTSHSAVPYPGLDSYSETNNNNSKIMNWLKSAVSDRYSEQETWRSYTSITFFLLFAFFSAVFYFFAMFTLPLIMFAPYKFGLFLTCGTLCLLVSIAFLKSFDGLAEHMTASKRLPFTAALFISIFTTLIFTLIKPLYILGFISSCVEVVVLFSFIGSFVPGGADTLKSLYSGTWKRFNGMLFRRRDQDVLPF